MIARAINDFIHHNHNTCDHLLCNGQKENKAGSTKSSEYVSWNTARLVKYPHHCKPDYDPDYQR